MACARLALVTLLQAHPTQLPHCLDRVREWMDNSLRRALSNECVSIQACVCQYTIRDMLAADKPVVTAPLTQLSEEEAMFQASVRQFSQERLAPHVRSMDEAGVFRSDLLHAFFELGLMAIDVPEQYEGQG